VLILLLTLTASLADDYRSTSGQEYMMWGIAQATLSDSDIALGADPRAVESARVTVNDCDANLTRITWNTDGTIADWDHSSTCVGPATVRIFINAVRDDIRQIEDVMADDSTADGPYEFWVLRSLFE